MNNGLYHIQDNKIYKMSLNEPMKQVGTAISDEAVMSIIDTVTEYMYCNYGDYCMDNKMADWKIVNVKWKENADLPTEFDLPESCLNKNRIPDRELIMYWLEDEIGYACDGFEVITKASFQEFEQTYGYLLPWEDAEKVIGRRLDWNNNKDCCIYHDLLMEKVKNSKEA